MINADASQVYAGLRVLSAAPPRARTRRGPSIACSASSMPRQRLVGGRLGGRGARGNRAGAWRRAAADPGRRDRPLSDHADRRHRPGAADRSGGSPGGARPAARRKITRCLTDADPTLAAELAPGDSARIARALEVVRSTGRSIASWRAERGRRNRRGGSPRRNRPATAARRRSITLREPFRGDAGDGAVDEVNALIARRLDPGLPAMRTIGVREIAAWRDGRTSLEEAKNAAVTATRRYAKRQYTWFNNQPPENWRRITAQVDDELATSHCNRVA